MGGVLPVPTGADHARQIGHEGLALLVGPPVVQPDRVAGQDRGGAAGCVGVVLTGQPRDSLHRAMAVLAAVVGASVEANEAGLQVGKNGGIDGHGRSLRVR